MDRELEVLDERFWGKSSDDEASQNDLKHAFEIGRRGGRLTRDSMIGAITHRANRIDDNRTKIIAELPRKKREIEALARQLAFEDGRFQFARGARARVEPAIATEKRKDEELDRGRKKKGPWGRIVDAIGSRIERLTKSDEDLYDDFDDDADLEEFEESSRIEQELARDGLDDDDHRHIARELQFSHMPDQPHVSQKTEQLIVRHNIRHKEQFNRFYLYAVGVIAGVLVFIGSMFVDFAIMSEFWTRALANEFLEVPEDLVLSVWSKSAQVIFSAFAIHFFLKAIGPFWRVYMVGVFALTVAMLLGLGWLNAQGTLGGFSASAPVPSTSSTNGSGDDALLRELGLAESANSPVGAGNAEAAAGAPAAGAGSGGFELPGLGGVDPAVFASVQPAIYLTTLSVIFLIVTSVGAFSMGLAEKNFSKLIAARRHLVRQREYNDYQDAWKAWNWGAATLRRIEDPEQRRGLLLGHLMNVVGAYKEGQIRRGGWFVGAGFMGDIMNRIISNKNRFDEYYNEGDPDAEPGLYNECLEAFEDWNTLMEAAQRNREMTPRERIPRPPRASRSEERDSRREPTIVVDNSPRSDDDFPPPPNGPVERPTS